MFAPLAFTLGFALVGALIYTLTLVPALSSILLRKNVKEKHNPIVIFFEKGVKYLFEKAYKVPKTSLIVAISFMVLTFFSAKFLGSEFLPDLDEGALWVKAQLPMSASLSQSKIISDKMTSIIRKYPEVRHTLAQIGRTINEMATIKLVLGTL